MLKLKNIDIDEFKKTVYPEYLKLFPKSERKPYKRLEESFKNGILNIIQILDDDVFIGFIITNSVKNNKYLQLDYFGFLPQYQGKGYGTSSIKMLEEISKEYNGIFIEIEKVGLGDTKEENEIRQRRANFYEKLGFYKLNFDFELFNVIYTPYVLPTSNARESEDKIIKDIFEMYVDILGRPLAEKKCRFYNAVSG